MEGCSPSWTCQLSHWVLLRGIIGLTSDDENNFEHIAQQCLLLCTDYVHQLVLSYAGKDMQGMHRNDLVKTMRGVFRENPKARMSVRDIGALEAFSAKAGPLPKAKKHRGENDDDERSSWTQSQYLGSYTLSRAFNMERAHF